MLHRRTVGCVPCEGKLQALLQVGFCVSALCACKCAVMCVSLLGFVKGLRLLNGRGCRYRFTYNILHDTENIIYALAV